MFESIKKWWTKRSERIALERNCKICTEVQVMASVTRMNYWVPHKCEDHQYQK